MNKLLLLFGTLLLMACETIDPGNTVNHVHVGKYIIDLTFGPIATLVVAPLIVWAIKRILDKLFEKIEAAQRLKDELDHERHTKVVDKLDTMCERFDKVDKRFYNHGHRIVIRDGSSHTEDIIIKQGIDV